MPTKTKSILFAGCYGLLLFSAWWGSGALLEQDFSRTNAMGTVTEGPAVYMCVAYVQTNILSSPWAALSDPPVTLSAEARARWMLYKTQKVYKVTVFTNRVFEHFQAGSFNDYVWTNFIAHTNGRTTVVWSQRIHPPGWPAKSPVVTWDTNCLMWGMKGLTALSPCWESEGYSGQVPITALTRRHGYTRGHDMGPDGFSTRRAGQKVWFLTLDNQVVEVKVKREVVRTMGTANRDYTIVLFDRDLPADIGPIGVTSWTNVASHYSILPDAPCPVFMTEQGGNVSAQVDGFRVPILKGGDSGSPNLLPLPGELVFYGGRTTSSPSQEMQTDMNELCRQDGLNFRHYQMRWVNLP